MGSRSDSGKRWALFSRTMRRQRRRKCSRFSAMAFRGERFSCRSCGRAFRGAALRRFRLREAARRSERSGRSRPPSSGSQSRMDGGRSHSRQGLQPSGKSSRSPAASGFGLPSCRGGAWAAVFFLSSLIGSPYMGPSPGMGGPECSKKVTICYQCLSYRFFPLPSSPERSKKARVFRAFPAFSTADGPGGGFSVPYWGWELVTKP